MLDMGERKDTGTNCVESSCVCARWTSCPLRSMSYLSVTGCAIRGVHLACLECLAQWIGVEHLPRGLLGVASAAGKDECREFLLAMGYRESMTDLQTMIMEASSAEAFGASISRLLPDGEAGDKFLATLVSCAIRNNNHGCMKALYDHDNTRTRTAVSRHALQTLACSAICHKNLACLRLLVARNGAPVLLDSCSESAAKGGEDIIKYVHGELKFPAELDVPLKPSWMFVPLGGQQARASWAL